MATQINLGKVPYSYNKDTKTFLFSEKNVNFATTYDLINPKTNKIVSFDLLHSTGSEWDPNTIWIYANSDKSLFVHVGQDANITKMKSKLYLDHKLLN